jgi:SAM-dependent methyltransferase
VNYKIFENPLPKKEDLLRQIRKNSKVLDVGCGNNGPAVAKDFQPNIYYVGVDIMNYNQESAHMADEYHLFPEELFINSLDSLSNDFDYVLCMHVLEHSKERDLLLGAMARRLKSGGILILMFPNQLSIHYPSRDGTLNYYDDPTHVDSPPSFSATISKLKDSGMNIKSRRRFYSSPRRFLWGLRSELDSIKQNKVMRHTWALWGFESIIIAEKK